MYMNPASPAWSAEHCLGRAKVSVHILQLFQIYGSRKLTDKISLGLHKGRLGLYKCRLQRAFSGGASEFSVWRELTSITKGWDADLRWQAHGLANSCLEKKSEQELYFSATCDVAKMFINPRVRSAVMSASSRFYLGLPSIPHHYELHGRVCKNPTVCTVANRVYCGSNEAPSREEDKQEQSDHCWAEHSRGERMDGGPRLTIPFYILGSL